MGILLARRVAQVADSNKVSDAVRSAQAQVSAIDKEDGEPLELNILAPAAVVEVQAVPPETNGQVIQLAEKIEAIKQSIEERISTLDGRRRRKYDNIARYDYRPIVIMLAQDSAVKEARAYRLVDLLTVWRSHRRKKHQLPQDKAAEIMAFEW